MKATANAGWVLMTLLVSGCAEFPKNMPLMFGETISFGVSIAGSAGEQGVDVTLGFKTRDIAIVPVAVETKEGTIEKLTASIVDGNTDAFSVIGQFDSKTDGGTGEIGLGKFFATGSAAQVLADGFRAKLSGNATPPSDKKNDKKKP